VIMAAEAKDNGYLEVADFITVVYYDKAQYPNGVRKFKTSQAEKEETAEETKEGTK